MQRSFNWQNSQRVDVPHLRMVESAVTADFQLLAGQVLAGGRPLVVRGFTVPVAGVVGNPAANLTLSTAGGILLHPTAAESGSVFAVSASQQAESLTAGNARVRGSFVPGTNYVGVDLVRTADSSTADSVRILSDTTRTEFPQTLPLGRTLGYRIYIQTTDFDHALNILPVAVVVVDANGNVTSISDARQMAFRLGRGGTSPQGRSAWTSMTNREEPGVTADGSHVIDPFTGGDKSLGSLSEWMAAVMQRLWEVGGGAYWYSPSADRDLKLNTDPAKTFAETADNWFWDGTDLMWQGIRYVFSGGAGGSWNKVADQLSPSIGLTNLVDGDCLYVEFDRTQNVAALPVQKGQYATLPQPAIPGSRRVIAWREFGQVYVDGSRFPLGGGGNGHASKTAFGIAKLWDLLTGDSQADGVVIAADSTGKAVSTGMTRPGVGVGAITIGGGAYDNVVNLGGGANNAPVNALGLLVASGGINALGLLTASGGTASRAGFNLAPLAAPSAPANGDLWVETTSNVLKARIAGSTKTFQTAPILRTDEPAVGQQVSASTGGFSTASAAFADVTNATVNITTTGRPVIVFLMSDGGGTESMLAIAAGADPSATMALRVLRGATEVARVALTTAVSGGQSFQVPPGTLWLLDAPAAGTYTYKVQAKTNSINETGQVNACKLCAFEL